MTLNIYVMPIIGAGTSSDSRRPKYRDEITAQWGMFSYGSEPWCLLGAVDISGAEHTTLTAHADVSALPVNLDQNVGAGALATVRNNLESVNIPGTWIVASTTWREAVRFVGAVCQFAQRFRGLAGGLWFTGGITLASTFSSLPPAARQGLLDTAASFGFDSSGLVGGSTLRQILISVGNQYTATQPPMLLAGTLI